MKSKILIIGGNGVVGKTIDRILRKRNPHYNIFIGSRKQGGSKNDLVIDVTKPQTFQAIVENKIDIVILSVNDKDDNVLRFNFSFGIGKRQAYNFDVPDLFILNRIEKVPNVNVKMTYNSKFITWLLGAFQKVRLYNILSLKERKMIFGSSGNGDQSVFEIIIKSDNQHKKISLQSLKGQAELTALSAVLHTEQLSYNHHENKIYFSHQLYKGSALMESLINYKTINITITE